MKLPVVFISAAFASGLALAGLTGRIAPPHALVAAAFAFLLLGMLLLVRNQARTAAACVVIVWVLLGVLALRLDAISVPINHVTHLIANGTLDANIALRWRGQLRQDPERLPWGLRYDVDLDEVEVGGAHFTISGGLRLSYFHNEREALPPEGLRAGDRVETLVRARPPRNFGNPGAADFVGALARQGIDLTASLRSGELLQKIAGPSPQLRYRFARLRGVLLARIDSLFASAPWPGAILRAMLLGDRSFIDRERADAFQKSSVYHVLVVAGLHVAALVAFILWSARRLKLGLFATTLLALAVLACYVGVVEDRPPILRAALMAVAYLTARLLYRRVELLNSIALAALVVLVARPSALSDASFQLSFLAVGTIAGLALPWIEHTSEPYRRGLAHISDVTRDAAHPPRVVQMRLDLRAVSTWLARKVPGRASTHAPLAVTLPLRAGIALWDIVLLSAAIQLGMLPLLALHFHRVSLAGPLANIPAVLLTGLIVPLGFLTLAVSFVWRAAGVVLAKLLGGLLTALSGSVDGFARLSWASYCIPGPPWWVIAAFLATLGCMAAATRATRRFRQIVVAVPLALLVIVVAIYPFAPHLERGKLEVTVIDVGQGDSIFVALPDGHTMLIDGGGTPGINHQAGMRIGLDTGEQVVAPYLWQRGIKRLDVVALTHAHQDHIGGLAAVLNDFHVNALWVGRDTDSEPYRALLAQAAVHRIPVIHHQQGELIISDGVEDRVLWPVSPEGTDPPKNDDSLVLRMVYGKSAMLLSGDVERPVENSLARSNYPLDADLLKVGHHGSKTSTTPQWLVKVHPRIAAISVGQNNPFGHPNGEVIERLEAAGVRVYRTDRDGAITVVSDGQSLTVRTFLRHGPP